MSEFRFLAGLGLPDYRLVGEALTPEEEAAGVRRATWGGRHGIAGASAEGPQAFADNVVAPLARTAFDLAVPQTPEDVALMLALGPVGSRAARVGLGAAGLTAGFSGEAEGGWFNPRQISRIAQALPENIWPRPANQFDQGSNSRVVAHGLDVRDNRRHAQRLEENFADAVTALNSDPVGTRPLRFPAQYSGEDINQAFQDTAPQLYQEFGWVRTPDEWLGMFPPNRGHSNISLAMAQPSQGWRNLFDPDNPMMIDPAVVAAEPQVVGPQVRAATYRPDQAPKFLGFLNPPATPGDPYYLGVRTGDHRTMATTMRHELQHLLQAERGAPANQRGTTSERVWQENPTALRQEYFTAAQADTDPKHVGDLARYRMYRAQPGEWEARTAGDALQQYMELLMGNPAALRPGVQNYFDPFANGFPDFRVR